MRFQIRTNEITGGAINFKNVQFSVDDNSGPFRITSQLEATDWMAVSDYTMSDSMKTWRQSLRDLPQDNTTEAEYDILLAQDEQGKLTNAIWSKP